MQSFEGGECMGWYDFINSNPIGKAFSKVASSAVNSVDSAVQKGFDKVDQKIDRMSKSAEKLGEGIDGLGESTGRMVRHGINRNDVSESISHLKDIQEGAEELKNETKIRRR
jgi:hypothetical protein